MVNCSKYFLLLMNEWMNNSTRDTKYIVVNSRYIYNDTLLRTIRIWFQGWNFFWRVIWIGFLYKSRIAKKKKRKRLQNLFLCESLSGCCLLIYFYARLKSDRRDGRFGMNKKRSLNGVSLFTEMGRAWWIVEMSLLEAGNCIGRKGERLNHIIDEKC